LRPIYENSVTLQDEANIQSLLERRFRVALHKMPISYQIDWLACRDDQAVAVIEYKRRHVKSSDYKTLVLSLKKWNAGLDYIRKNGLSFMFVAEWQDQIGWLSISDPAEVQHFKIAYGGRTAKTRDSADVEPVVHIPVAAFRTL